MACPPAFLISSTTICALAEPPRSARQLHSPQAGSPRAAQRTGIEVGNDDLGALGRAEESGGTSDALGGAGHDHDLAGGGGALAERRDRSVGATNSLRIPAGAEPNWPAIWLTRADAIVEKTVVGDWVRRERRAGEGKFPGPASRAPVLVAGRRAQHFFFFFLSYAAPASMTVGTRTNTG